jgi:hypothetical protein
MILSFSYDVEVLPNFFSLTFIDVNDYLKVFADACKINAKGKKEPIPLVQKYAVTEIKAKLSAVKKHKFYITDKDDSQLLTMLGYINQMRPHYDDLNRPIRSDVFGYNSSKYDDLMVSGLLMFANQTNTTKELITKLYELSKHIIDIQDKPELAKGDYLLNSLRKNKLPYIGIDVMTIFALNKVGNGVNDKGETIYFGKSLKQTSINLQWYELLEYELPPISDKDVDLYYGDYRYKGLPSEQINKLVNKWDRYILDEWIPDMMHYNENDVFIVCEMIRLFIDEIRLRYNISKSYEINVLSSSRSNIADKMFVKFYSKFSGLAPSQWQGRKTERTALGFKRVILPFIHFKTEQMQELLEEMKKVVIYSVGKKALKEIAPKYPDLKYLKTNNNSGWFEVTINNLTYTIATGGLHSKDVPRELKSKLIKVDNPSTGEVQQSIWDEITDDSYVYVHWDISSFYPSIMDVYRIAPAHMNEGIFVKLIHWLKETRITAKHSKEDYIDGIPKDVLAQVLKIVINSIYGKLGFEKGDICDRLAVLKVTINGQLMIMMLCEELELNGIEVMSANTDGIVVKLYKRKKEDFERIATNWKQLTKLDADSEEYKCYINRDINNYVIEELNGKVSYKGALNPNMYLVDLQKGYDMPIVAQAVVNYFLYNKPVLETLYECTNILDFCKTQNIGRQFHVEYTNNGQRQILQRNIRFYVTNRGGIVEKVDNNTMQRNNLCAGHQVVILNTLDDERIEYRNICYSYYYNEALKIIDPIKLGISPNQKGDASRKLKSGKALIKKHAGMYQSLFDDAED